MTALRQDTIPIIISIERAVVVAVAVAAAAIIFITVFTADAAAFLNFTVGIL